MKDLGCGVQERAMAELGRILNKDLFLYLLDLEVKRARRYQNFLCLLHIELSQLNGSDGNDLRGFYLTLCNLLMEEMRETDLLGSLGENQLVVLLPYTDPLAGSHAKSRLENVLKYYNFRGKGYEVIVNQICFPMHGTDIIDLLKEALEAKP